MRVAVLRNEPQTFVVFKWEPACSIGAILLQPVSVFLTTLEGPAGSGGRLSAVTFGSCISSVALCQLLFAYKINLPHSMLGEMLTHLKSLEPAFDTRSFQCSCFLLLWEGLGVLPSLYTRPEDEPFLSTPIPCDSYSGIVLILSEIFTVYDFDLMQA